ncbi:MAG: methyltransferase type 11 [Aquificae bacterium]|nr:methyltransferase type 11 [Aquificota bacterium]
METIKEGDLVLIRFKDRRYLKRVESDKNFSYKGGVLHYKDLVGKPFGITVGELQIFKPTLEEIILYGIRRETQIVYPKDTFYAAHKLDLREGKKVLEFGTGSGATALVFSSAVGPSGKVYTFEREERIYRVAKKNLERFAPYDNVVLFNEPFSPERVGEVEFDAAFVDVREPWPFVEAVWSVLKPSAPVGFLLPTANQVQELLRHLRPFFGDVEVVEILTRPYKPNPDRFRPEDQMVAHTAYLLFAKKLSK